MLSPVGSCDGLIGKRIVSLDSDTVLHMKTPLKGEKSGDTHYRHKSHISLSFT